MPDVRPHRRGQRDRLDHTVGVVHRQHTGGVDGHLAVQGGGVVGTELEQGADTRDRRGVRVHLDAGTDNDDRWRRRRRSRGSPSSRRRSCMAVPLRPAGSSETPVPEMSQRERLERVGDDDRRHRQRCDPVVEVDRQRLAGGVGVVHVGVQLDVGAGCRPLERALGEVGDVEFGVHADPAGDLGDVAGEPPLVLRRCRRRVRSRSPRRRRSPGPRRRCSAGSTAGVTQSSPSATVGPLEVVGDRDVDAGFLPAGVRVTEGGHPAGVGDTQRC